MLLKINCCTLLGCAEAIIYPNEGTFGKAVLNCLPQKIHYLVMLLAQSVDIR